LGKQLIRPDQTLHLVAGIAERGNGELHLRGNRDGNPEERDPGNRHEPLSARLRKKDKNGNVHGEEEKKGRHVVEKPLNDRRKEKGKIQNAEIIQLADVAACYGIYKKDRDMKNRREDEKLKERVEVPVF